MSVHNSSKHIECPELAASKRLFEKPVSHTQPSQLVLCVSRLDPSIIEELRYRLRISESISESQITTRPRSDWKTKKEKGVAVIWEAPSKDARTQTHSLKTWQLQAATTNYMTGRNLTSIILSTPSRYNTLQMS